MNSRPRSIRLFEILFFLSFALGATDFWLNIRSFPEIPIFSFVPLLQIGALVGVLGLALLVSRKGMKWAMWTLILLTTLGLPSVYVRLTSGLSNYAVTITLVQSFSEIIALLFLFTGDSRSWLNEKSSDKH